MHEKCYQFSQSKPWHTTGRNFLPESPPFGGEKVFSVAYQLFSKRVSYCIENILCHFRYLRICSPPNQQQLGEYMLKTNIPKWFSQYEFICLPMASWHECMLVQWIPINMTRWHSTPSWILMSAISKFYTGHIRRHNCNTSLLIFSGSAFYFKAGVPDWQVPLDTTISQGKNFESLRRPRATAKSGRFSSSILLCKCAHFMLSNAPLQTRDMKNQKTKKT